MVGMAGAVAGDTEDGVDAAADGGTGVGGAVDVAAGNPFNLFTRENSNSPVLNK